MNFQSSVERTDVGQVLNGRCAKILAVFEERTADVNPGDTRMRDNLAPKWTRTRRHVVAVYLEHVRPEHAEHAFHAQILDELERLVRVAEPDHVHHVRYGVGLVHTRLAVDDRRQRAVECVSQHARHVACRGEERLDARRLVVVQLVTEHAEGFLVGVQRIADSGGGRGQIVLVGALVDICGAQELFGPRLEQQHSTMSAGSLSPLDQNAAKVIRLVHDVQVI